MISGSLVCLSPDHFETFFFATVAGQRIPEKLAKGEFVIKLEIESPAMLEISSMTNFVMVESQVYFEVFPFQKYKKFENETSISFVGISSQFESVARVWKGQFSARKIHRRCE